MHSKTSYLPNHPVPNPVHQFAVFPIGDQVKVEGELDGFGQLLEDIYAETLAAQFGEGLGVTEGTARREKDNR